MSIKFCITINGNEILLDAQRLEALVDVLSQCEAIDTKYVGTNKGWYGSGLEYETKIGALDSTKHLGNLRVIRQETVDKYVTLEAMKNNTQA